MIRLALLIVAVATLTLSLSSCYVTTQGYHLIADQIRATPVERMRRREALNPETELLFERVATVRAYATTELGLAEGTQYTRYVATDREYLVDVVSAAGELSFERKEWWFPFFGRFPYRGYYRRAAAERMAERLRGDGWDVIVRRVDGFSTLGFFSDPLYTYMARYDEARLAELIIHEMAHATLWVRSQAQFNEEFADFVGRAGSRQYLVERYGEDSAVVAALDARRADAERFRQDVLALKEALREVYSQSVPDDAKRLAKAETISAYQAQFLARYETRYESDAYRAFAETTVNNAYLDLFTTYSGNRELFERVHAEVGGGDLRTTIARITAWATSSPDDPYAPLRSALP